MASETVVFRLRDVHDTSAQGHNSLLPEDDTWNTHSGVVVPRALQSEHVALDKAWDEQPLTLAHVLHDCLVMARALAAHFHAAAAEEAADDASAAAGASCLALAQAVQMRLAAAWQAMALQAGLPDAAGRRLAPASDCILGAQMRAISSLAAMSRALDVALEATDEAARGSPTLARQLLVWLGARRLCARLGLRSVAAAMHYHTLSSARLLTESHERIVQHQQASRDVVRLAASRAFDVTIRDGVGPQAALARSESSSIDSDLLTEDYDDEDAEESCDKHDRARKPVSVSRS